MSEQWKTMGLCKLCRRRKYCRKHCRATKARIREILSEFIEKSTGIAEIKQTIAEARESMTEKKGGQ